jgi:hypothetical protein
MTELWRKVPENPEYELSNQGRLRGPMGKLCMPDISNRSIAAARYALPIGRDRRVYLGISEVMKRIWNMQFVPTAKWVTMVRSEVTRALERRRSERRASRARVSAERRAIASQTDDQVAQGQDDPVGEELWRVVPDHPRYEISNRGRMRGTCGILSPVVNGSSALSAKYQLWIPAPARRSVSLSIRQTMLRVWDIRFAPTMAWIEQVKSGDRFAPLPERSAPKVVEAQPEPAVAVAAVVVQAKPQKPKSAGSSNRPDAGMPCPWESGKLDTHPSEITTWDCAQMDPLTHRGENGVWVQVPATVAERRKLMREMRKEEAA